MEMITLTIDGQEVKATERKQILEAALENGIYIPNLCYDRRLRPCDACRLCVGEKKKPHRIIQEICLHCRSCYETCKFKSIKILPAGAREASEAELLELAGVAAPSGVQEG